MFGMLSSAYMLTCLNIDYVEDTRSLGKISCNSFWSVATLFPFALLPIH
jgi:hypothetical protein